MSDIRQLPGSYIETFREAVEAVNDFARGGRERSVTYEGRPVRVGYIIGVASQYRDVMPPDLHRRLCEVALPGEEPEDITFSAGAKALRARYNDIMKKRRIKADVQPFAAQWVPTSRAGGPKGRPE
jgi:hypothetical protein